MSNAPPIPDEAGSFDQFTRSGADLWDIKGHVTRPARSIPVIEDLDVVCAGGGITGIIAALASARLGARTMVVEPFGCLGGNMGPGMFAGGSLHLALKNPEAFPDGLGGIPQEFNERVVDHEQRLVGSDYIRDSKTVPYVATKMLEEAGAQILLYSAVVDVLKEGQSVRGIFVENKSGTLAIRCRAVVDCTGTADVADRAGAPVVELERDPSMGVFFAVMGVDAQRHEQALAERGELGDADRQWLQANAPGAGSLMPWAREAWEAGEFQIVQIVDGFASLEVGIKPVKGDPPVLRGRTRVNGRFHPGDGLALSRIGQQQWCYLYEFVRFLNRRVPGYENACLTIVSPYLQARGGKSIDSEYALTVDDVVSGARFDDVVYTYYDDKRFIEGGCDVPYRMLLPRGVDGVLASGRSAMRRGPQFRQRYSAQQMGQVAGTAAALSARRNVAPRDLDIRLLQRTLLEAGAFVAPRKRLEALGLV